MLTEADAQRLVHHTEDAAVEHPVAMKGVWLRSFGGGLTYHVLQGSHADC